MAILWRDVSLGGSVAGTDLLPYEEREIRPIAPNFPIRNLNIATKNESSSSQRREEQLRKAIDSRTSDEYKEAVQLNASASTAVLRKQNKDDAQARGEKNEEETNKSMRMSKKDYYKEDAIHDTRPPPGELVDPVRTNNGAELETTLSLCDTSPMIGTPIVSSPPVVLHDLVMKRVSSSRTIQDTIEEHPKVDAPMPEFVSARNDPKRGSFQSGFSLSSSYDLSPGLDDDEDGSVINVDTDMDKEKTTTRETQNIRLQDFDPKKKTCIIDPRAYKDKDRLKGEKKVAIEEDEDRDTRGGGGGDTRFRKLRASRRASAEEEGAFEKYLRETRFEGKDADSPNNNLRLTKSPLGDKEALEDDEDEIYWARRLSIAQSIRSGGMG